MRSYLASLILGIESESSMDSLKCDLRHRLRSHFSASSVCRNITIQRLTLALGSDRGRSSGRNVEAPRRSEGAKERDQIALLLAGQFRSEHQIEELNRIIECQQAPIVQIGRRIFDAAQREGLDGSVANFIQAVDPSGLKKRSVLRSCIRLSV